MALKNRAVTLAREELAKSIQHDVEQMKSIAPSGAASLMIASMDPELAAAAAAGELIKYNNSSGAGEGGAGSSGSNVNMEDEGDEARRIKSSTAVCRLAIAYRDLTLTLPYRRYHGQLRSQQQRRAAKRRAQGRPNSREQIGLAEEDVDGCGGARGAGAGQPAAG